MSKESAYYKEIIEKLSKLKRKEYSLLAIIGLQASVFIGLVLFSFFSLLELIGNFNPAVRTYFFFFTLLLFLLALTVLVIIPLLRYSGIMSKTDYYGTASRVGRNFPDIKDDLLNAMQLAVSESSGLIYSGSLSDAAFRQVYDKTRSLKFESIVNFQKAKELLLYVAGATLFTAVLFLFVPGLSEASFRVMNFDTEFIPPARFHLKYTRGTFR